MTTKDKTGDQLMASIRKAKTEGATPEKAPAGDAQKPAPTNAAPVAKARPAAAGTSPKRPRVTKKKVAAKSRPPEAKAPESKAPESKAAASKARTRGSAYQSVGRVWPD